MPALAPPGMTMSGEAAPVAEAARGGKFPKMKAAPSFRRRQTCAGGVETLTFP